MLREKFTENLNYSQFFSFEVLDYFDSICTDENYEWIVKYFDVLMKEENETAEKFNKHHIRPCCTFKDDKHKKRNETQKLGDKFNGNITKLSIYNHLFAHYYLWKIFNNRDSKEAFQRMCGEGKYIDNLTENELKEIARLKEDCAKINLIGEELRLHKNQSRRKYNQSEKGKISKCKYKHSEKGKNKRKEYENSKRGKEVMSKIGYKYRNSEKGKQTREKWLNNGGKIWQEEYNKSEKGKRRAKKYYSKPCYDPIEKDFPNLGALRARKIRNKEKYKNINPKDCVLKNES